MDEPSSSTTSQVQTETPSTDKNIDRQSSAESGIQSYSSEHSNSLTQSDGEEKGVSEVVTNDETVKASDSESESPGPATPNAQHRNDDVPASPHKSPHKSPAKKETVQTKSLLKKPSSPKGSKRIRFACVREYVFPRKQSFCTLPSTGGCALGMASQHLQQLTLPLPQHRERLHSKRRKKVRHWRRKQRKISENQVASSAINASDLSTSKKYHYPKDAPEEDLSGVDDWWFLQSISPKKRRKILKRHISDVDSQDRLNNRGLRKERDVCGCNCQSVCYPDTCECALNDIPCQVDRDGFPCGCMAGRCGNAAGRRSFNSARVRHHFFKTMYRLRCHEQGTDTIQTSPSTNAEVPIDEPQQPFSFGDFTKPSDYHGTVFWPQQWTEPGPSSNQWSGMQQQENVSSRLCNESQPSTSGVGQQQPSSTEESSTEAEPQTSAQSNIELDQSETNETEQHEIDMTVNVNDEQQSRDSHQFDESDSDSDKYSASDKEDSDRSDKMSDSDDTNQSDQSDD